MKSRIGRELTQMFVTNLSFQINYCNFKTFRGKKKAAIRLTIIGEKENWTVVRGIAEISIILLAMLQNIVDIQMSTSLITQSIKKYKIYLDI